MLSVDDVVMKLPVASTTHSSLAAPRVVPSSTLSSVAVDVTAVPPIDRLVVFNPVVVAVPFTCNVVVGSEVPIPTRLFVTSRYSRFVSNARSVPFLVKFDFSTDPDIRPMAILQYSSIIVLAEHMLHTVSLSLPTDSSMGIYAPKKKGRP